MAKAQRKRAPTKTSYTASARASAVPVKRAKRAVSVGSGMAARIAAKRAKRKMPIKRPTPRDPTVDRDKCLIVGRHHRNFPEGEYEVCLTPNQRRTLFRGQDPGVDVGCGTFACAYAKPGAPKRVIKFTRDAADVAALLKAQGTGVVPEVYATYKLKQPSTYRSSDETTPVYAVEIERLKPLSEVEREMLRDNRQELVLASFDDAAGHRYAEDFHEQCAQDIGPVCATFRAMEKLRAAGIKWHDIHAGNVGYDAKHTLKVLDLGLTHVGFKRKQKPKTLAGLRRALAGARAALKRTPKL